MASWPNQPDPDARYTVTFRKSGVSTTGTRKQYLLDIAKAAGVEIPSICRGGTCGTCMVVCLSGRVVRETDAILSPTELGRGYVLTCSARPASDVVLDA